jgi:hypothetical protein
MRGKKIQKPAKGKKAKENNEAHSASDHENGQEKPQ